MYRRIVSALPIINTDYEKSHVEITAKDIALGFTDSPEQLINTDVCKIDSSKYNVRISIRSIPESVRRVYAVITLTLTVRYEDRPHNWKDLIIEWDGKYEKIDHPVGAVNSIS